MTNGMIYYSHQHTTENYVRYNYVAVSGRLYQN